MLILQRRTDEAILIGGEIRVVVLRTDGGGVRLGIDAPAHVSILREEILDQVRAENLKASQVASQIAKALPKERGVPAPPTPSITPRVLRPAD